MIITLNYLGKIIYLKKFTSLSKMNTLMMCSTHSMAFQELFTYLLKLSKLFPILFQIKLLLLLLSDYKQHKTGGVVL